jgi:hypothetical protein
MLPHGLFVKVEEINLTLLGEIEGVLEKIEEVSE